MLTGLAGKIMTYDGENRPLSVTHLGKRTCYVYGIDGKRLKKVEGLPPTQDCTALPANTNATVYFGAVEVRNWRIAGAEQILTYPHPAVKLLNDTTPAAATYLHRDGLSSVRAITNPAGVKIEAALYKPFGEQSEWVLPGNAAPETKGWIGERYDADAGLQYLNARYYDPELSLFLQPDWFEVTKAGVGTNRFSYSFNDPVNGRDANGNCLWDACIAESYAATAAFVAIVGYLATDAIDNGKIDASHVRSTMEALGPDPWNESFPADPNASAPTILGNPSGEPWPELNTEGYSTDVDSGPIVMSDPWGDDYSRALEGKIIATTPGSYEIFMEKDGKKYIYVGKGDEARMKESERRHQKEGNKVTESEWEKASDHRGAFKDEDRKMAEHGGDERSKSDKLTNKIDSPGKKYRDEDDD